MRGIHITLLRGFFDPALTRPPGHAISLCEMRAAT
jgi:hypothetical protein